MTIFSAAVSRMVSRPAIRAAGLLLILATGLYVASQEFQGPPHSSAEILFPAAIGLAVLALLVWRSGGHRPQGLETDHRELADGYRAILDASPEGVIVCNAKNDIVLATRRAEQLFGYGEGEMVGLPLEALVPESHRERHRQRREYFRGLIEGNAIYQGERMLALRKDGQYFLCAMNVGARTRQNATTITLFVQDISLQARHEAELERIHHVLRLLTEANQALRQATNRDELFQSICQTILRVGGHRFVWIGLAEDDARKTVRPVAWAGTDEGALQRSFVSWDESSPYGQGTAGPAIRNGYPVIVRSTSTDARMAPWVETMRQQGLASVGAFPLHIERGQRGVLLIYATVENAFGSEECHLLEKLATDIGRGVDTLHQAEIRSRAEAALRRSEATLDRAQQIAQIGSWDWDLKTQAVIWSDQNYRLFGYRPGEIVPHKNAVMARTHPEDRPRLAECLRTLVAGSTATLEIDHRILWEDGTVRHVHMLCEAQFEAGRAVRIIGTTQDTTARVLHEAELQRTNRALRILSAVTRATREADSEAALLRRICEVVVKSGGYTFAWIAGKGPEPEKRVLLRAWAGKPEMRQPIDDGLVTWDAQHPYGNSTAGMALRSGAPCVVRDTLSDPAYASWKNYAQEMGYNASGAFPIRIEGRVESALVIYAGNDTFGDAEHELLEDLAGDIGHAIAYLRADLARNQAEIALRRNEALLGRAEALAHIGSWEWDMRSRELQWSEESYRILGFEPHEVVPTHALAMQCIHPEDRTALKEKLDAVVEGETLSAEMDCRIVLPDERVRWVRTKVEMEYHDTGPLRLVAVLQDISERKQFEEKLSEMASFDALTGLPNRNLLNDRLGQALAHADRQQGEMAVGFIDLDRFKLINDTLGHDAGDELLKEIARRLSGCLRNCDTVARLGGDEFVVVITDLRRREDATVVAQKLLEALTPPVTICGREIVPGASLGFALFPQDGDNLQALLMAADKAMYAAKQAGRGQYRFFDLEMNRSASNWLEVGAELHHALERDEFELHYQPKLDLHLGTITGVEALLRWRSPEKGLVSPAQFIPILEETGLILEVGEWVIARACRQWRAWREQGLPALRIAVNLSARQFQSAQLAERIRFLIDQPDFPPECLELEITESMVMQNVDRAVATLAELRALGVRIAIDDFGTGYSSLAMLKRFPLDCLKVDRSFVCDIPADADDMAITQAVIALAHSMQLSVVAEGVETEAQRNFLLESGCDEIQGFLFSKPLPAEDLARRVLEHQDRAIRVA